MLELSPIKNADPKSQNSDTASVENKHYDGTHLNAKGGEVVGKIVADEVKKVVPDLSSHIK